KVDRPLAPISERLDQERRPTLIARTGILIVVEVAVALEEAESLGASLDVERVGEFARIVEVAPDLLAIGADDLQPVAVMHLAAIVVEGASVVFGKQEHGGHGRNAKTFDIAADEQPRGHLHYRVLAGGDGKGIGARHA